MDPPEVLSLAPFIKKKKKKKRKEEKKEKKRKRKGTVYYNINNSVQISCILNYK